jgi:hypothetical protein
MDPPDDLDLVTLLCDEPTVGTLEACHLLGLPDVPDDDPGGDDDR